MSKAMAEGKGLEPLSPKAPVFKTGALPITLTLRKRRGGNCTGVRADFASRIGTRTRADTRIELVYEKVVQDLSR